VATQEIPLDQEGSVAIGRRWRPGGLKIQLHSVHHMFMPDKKNRYAEVANKAKAKRADLDNKTAARKAKALKEDVAQTATRLLRESTKK
jgi:hypothetical protein